MKYRIAICDDEQIHSDLIVDFLGKLTFNLDINFVYDIYPDPKKLLAKIESVGLIYDLLLLDVEMDVMDGMTLGKEIKKIDPNAMIIYITGYKDYAFEAFEVKAFQYLMKPIRFEKFQKVILEALEKIESDQLKKNHFKYFVIDRKNESFKIRYDEIFYFEKQMRKVRIVTKNGDFEYYGSMKTLVDEIDKNCFTKCHQSYLVNNDKISTYKNKEIFIDEINHKLPVSKNCIKNIKVMLKDQLFT